jgi:hypothetical protein
MTAFLAVRQPDSVTILIDGASYDPSGVVVRLAPKFVTLPGSNSVLVTRGLQTPIELLDRLFPFESLRTMMTRADVIVSSARRAGRHQHGPIGAFEVLIAGVENGRARYFYSPSEGNFRELDDFYFAAGPVLDVRTMLAAGCQPLDDAAEFDTFKHGLPMMEAFRRTPIDGLYGVGGFVTETRIGVNGIRSRIIHRWPDEIGQKISHSGPNAASD